MKEIIMYQCEHCLKRKYMHKSSAKAHEKKCFWNPSTKSCMTCNKYFQPDETTLLKVVGENTVCAYADDYTLFNTKCTHWEEIKLNEHLD